MNARDSHRRCSIKKLFIKLSQYSQGNNCVRVLFFNKRGIQACNFIKKRLQHRCFPVNIETILRTPTLKNICERLLLERFLFSVYDGKRVKLLNHLRLNFSQLRKASFLNIFRKISSALCHCGGGIESTEDFLLRCEIFKE